MVENPGAMANRIDGDQVQRSPGIPAWHWLLFAGILCAAVCLRFTGLNWDEGQWIHPDEGHMRMITGAIHAA